jgi:23S rRNA pseudouridine2605 synthase
MAEERLQKVLARAGVASRRAAEALMRAGRVKVDGRVVSELGSRVDPERARVELDGRRLVSEPFVYIVLHKPRGVVSTLHDPEGRRTIADLVRGAGARVAPIGRLDYHTSGALLCTNDGEFAQAIAHPKQGAEKEYVVKVKGIVDDAALARWRERITIDGRLTRPAEVARLRVEGDKSWLSVTLREGRNRQVRKMGEATGFPVMRLVRLAHAGVTTEGLRPGEWRYLSLDELVALKKRYGVPRKVRAAPGRTKPRPAPSRAFPREKRPISRRGGRASARRPGTSR